jgi:hypothetical protein
MSRIPRLATGGGGTAATLGDAASPLLSAHRVNKHNPATTQHAPKIVAWAALPNMAVLAAMTA